MNSVLAIIVVGLSSLIAQAATTQPDDWDKAQKLLEYFTVSTIPALVVLLIAWNKIKNASNKADQAVTTATTAATEQRAHIQTVAETANQAAAKVTDLAEKMTPPSSLSPPPNR